MTRLVKPTGDELVQVVSNGHPANVRLADLAAGMAKALSGALYRLKNPVKIASSAATVGATSPVASNRVRNRFVVLLQAGSSASGIVEQSEDNGSSWSTVVSFSLSSADLGVPRECGPFDVRGTLVRCNFSAINGVVDVYGGE